MSAPTKPVISTSEQQLPATGFGRPGLVLGGLILIEILVFSTIGTNFLSWANAAQLLRLNTELVLLALAMTLVIVAGGIDLSVGSLLGLSAVVFGKLVRDANFSPGAAIALTLLLGVGCGALNGLLIARLRIPPLIVTLGTFSLFRGLAEGITGGVDNFTNFQSNFLWLGQGFIGPFPAQLPVLILAITVFYFLLHRSMIGRALSVIGFTPDGAKFAGIPVARRILFAYALSGLMVSIAAVLYVARVGQAKADAGTGYEISAIAAVVLGGTSIFGGRGSIPGTVMGVLAIALLENGFRLADFPPEIAGIFKGILLIVALGMGAPGLLRLTTSGTRRDLHSNLEKSTMRNSQLAALCVVILLAAGLIVLGNYVLLKNVSLVPAGLTVGDHKPTAADRKITVAMMPKSKGNAYFIACRKGAEEAAKELDINLLWDGPTDPDPARQNEIVDTWITRGVDVIVVSVENRDGLSTALRKARQSGVKVVTFDADALPDARDFFVNSATPSGIGSLLMDHAAKALGDQGEFAIISASLTAANQNEWIKWIKARQAEKYPGLKLATIRPCDDLQARAFEETRTILNAHPEVKVIVAICSPAVPGAAEAVKQSGRKDVKVVGLGLPNDNKPYVHGGITTAVVLWNTMDLGYLAVQSATKLARGELKAGQATLRAGRLGQVEIVGDNIMLGVPFTFDKGNIDNFDF